SGLLLTSTHRMMLKSCSMIEFEHTEQPMLDTHPIVTILQYFNTPTLQYSAITPLRHYAITLHTYIMNN
ncbi:MAG: hypothetical protein Q7J10_03550, partial [Methanosarcinaceae archaeon]|nr:hypothetical protein [Methanosarcinaceae archaeon]